MKKTIKNIASVAGIGIFSLFAIASVDETTSSSSSTSVAAVKQAPSTFTVTASEIAKAFEKNEVAANLKYENKVGEVTGSITTISKDFGSYNVMLKGEDWTGVVLRFDGDVSTQLAELEIGQRITAKGMCDGMFGNIEFDSCVIIAK